MRRVGFQGVRGAYSELAIANYFEGEKFVVRPFASFAATYQALVDGHIHDALLPFENSLAGMIHENYDHLARFPITIIGEAILEVQHCLLVPPGRKLKDIRTVISHPQALAQCGNFLRRKAWIIQDHFDTAGAAAFLAETEMPGYAAIASEKAAELYKLDIVARRIADRGQNYTRFLHLRSSRSRARKLPLQSEIGRWFSLLLLQAGAGFGRIGPLCGILQSLGIELIHCEARPTKAEAWSYFYFLELAASPEHPSWNLAIDTLNSLTRTCKYLGSYRSQR